MMTFGRLLFSSTCSPPRTRLSAAEKSGAVAQCEGDVFDRMRREDPQVKSVLRAVTAASHSVTARGIGDSYATAAELEILLTR